MVTRFLRRASLAVAFVAIAAATGCDLGPFARVNPSDPDASITITIVASRDTVTIANPYIAFQAVVEPATSPVFPTWESNFAGFVHQGDGVFRLTSPQASVVPIDVRVRFPAGSKVYRVYGAPDP